MGPFDRWPTGYGFEHFYGFLAGETSQWEPRLVNNTTIIEPPHDPAYHLTADLADQTITWLRQHRSFAPDKPFFIYWAPGAAHGPHHITGAVQGRVIVNSGDDRSRCCARLGARHGRAGVGLGRGRQ